LPRGCGLLPRRPVLSLSLQDRATCDHIVRLVELTSLFAEPRLQRARFCWSAEFCRSRPMQARTSAATATRLALATRSADCGLAELQRQRAGAVPRNRRHERFLLARRFRSGGGQRKQADVAAQHSSSRGKRAPSGAFRAPDARRLRATPARKAPDLPRIVRVRSCRQRLSQRKVVRCESWF